MIAPFEYRKLGPTSTRLYKLHENGRIYLRGKVAPREPAIVNPCSPKDATPIATTIQPFPIGPAKGGEVSGMLAEWRPTEDGEAWELRTKGAPLTVKKIRVALAKDIKQAVDETGIDPRILIVQTACEAAYSSTHPSGKDPLSPRTEPGYPGRKGEMDFGDPERDALDVKLSGGRHASFGYTQCLLKTAKDVRPDLFPGDPRRWRYVLGEPINAFRCIAALYFTLREEVRADPLATRAVFGAGAVIRDPSNGWGVRVYHPSVIGRWIAMWNDCAADLEEADALASAAERDE